MAYKPSGGEFQLKCQITTPLTVEILPKESKDLFFSEINVNLRSFTFNFNEDFFGNSTEAVDISLQTSLLSLAPTIKASLPRNQTFQSQL